VTRIVRFDDRVAIVTGAGNGLGRAYALELARRGASVVVNDLGGSTDGRDPTPAAADFVVEEIRGQGGTAIASYDSIAEDGGCRRLAAIALETFGRIDAVIHNAGILRNAMFEEMSDENFFPVLSTHLLGSFYLSRAAWPTMVEQGYGRFVLTSSSSGVWGRPNGANYNTAKAGVIGLANALSLEGADKGILTNCILPVGFTRLAGAPEAVDTSADAEARRAEALAARWAPEWVAPMVVYLASEACDRTHRYYSAVDGRYARVFVGVAEGWRAGNNPPSVEEIRENLDAIEELSSYDVPENGLEEIERVRGRSG